MNWNHTLYRTVQGAGVLLATTMLLSGCGPMAPRPDTPAGSYPQDRPTVSPPTAYSPRLGPAASLYHKAGDEMSAGNYVQAEELMERALRIEPKNSYYWYVLAQVKYWQRQYPQAVQMCLKSKSIAGNDTQLIQLNDALINKARQR